MSEKISLRLPRETLRKLSDLAEREGKARSTLIRELLVSGVKEKDFNNAVELYRRGRATGWKAAQLAGTSLCDFFKVLREKGIHVQYSEHNLEEDLKGLTEE